MEVLDSPLCKDSEDFVRGAVQRKYESQRRLCLLEDKENCDETLNTIAKMKRYRSRKERKYENCTTVVRDDEIKDWKQLDHRYMTDESDDEEGSLVIIEHKLQWRSPRLNTLIEELDKRYEAKVNRDGGTMPRKERKEGCFSPSIPPLDAPKWAVLITDSVNT